MITASSGGSGGGGTTYEKLNAATINASGSNRWTRSGITIPADGDFLDASGFLSTDSNNEAFYTRIELPKLRGLTEANLASFVTDTGRITVLRRVLASGGAVNDLRLRFGRGPSDELLIQGASHNVTFYKVTLAGSGGGGAAAIPDLYTIGLASNSKSVTRDTTSVRLSDWSTVALTANATATEGVTIASNRIAFAQAKKVTIKGAIVTSADDESRSTSALVYNDFRCEKVGSPNTVVKRSISGSFRRNSSNIVTVSTLEDGPVQQITHIDFDLDAAAGDSYEFKWRAFLRTNRTVQFETADSELSMRFVG